MPKRKTKRKAYISRKNSKKKNLFESQNAYEQGKNLYDLGMRLLNEENENRILEIILKLENKALKSKNALSKSINYYFCGMLTNEVGVRFNDLYYIEMGLGYLNLTNKKHFGHDHLFLLLFRIARSKFYIHNLRKHKEIFNYFDSAREFLIPANSLFQKVFREGIIDGKLKSKIIEKWTLEHLAHISAELNRWIEFQYYLNLIPQENRDQSFHVLNSLSLEAFLDFGHIDIYPELLNRIITSGNIAIEKYELSKHNKIEIEKLVQKLSTELSQMENQEDQHKNETNLNEFSKYREWTLKNTLSLNEHSIFCSCILSKHDDLSLETSNRHTQYEWINKFQILIDQLKYDFNQARYFFYCYQNNLNSIAEELKISSNTDNVLLNQSSRYLINSFKNAYSILDRITVSLFSVYEEIPQKKIQFHQLTSYIKKHIDITRNRYLVSLESLSIELFHQNPNATLEEYKTWRNDIEHNFFYLSRSKTNEIIKIPELNHLKNVTIVNIDNFSSRTEHLLQISRSAIFTLVFLIREECCIRFHRH